ncbi:MAG: hypothetical protein QW279_04440 [Candidatus Jordarchaeaceae archaeon]
MYKKILGLKQLEKMQFPVPPYQVIDITSDKPFDVQKYISNAIEKVKIPHEPGNRIGVTIRVSMPGPLDKLTKHGGLHVTEKEEIIKRIIGKYQQYGPNSKIIIQHTVDARCSGAIIREDDYCVLEAIPGDAPLLLEGQAASYEKWLFFLKSGKWIKEKVYQIGENKKVVLFSRDLQKFEEYIKALPRKAYLEWSISKLGELFFYEYCKLK